MAWQFSRKVLALFVGYEETNAHVYIDGGHGWKKFREDNIDAHANMLVAATHAKADDRYIDYDEDPAGFIRILYVW